MLPKRRSDSCLQCSGGPEGRSSPVGEPRSLIDANRFLGSKEVWGSFVKWNLTEASAIAAIAGCAAQPEQVTLLRCQSGDNYRRRRVLRRPALLRRPAVRRTASIARGPGFGLDKYKALQKEIGDVHWPAARNEKRPLSRD